MSLVFGWQSTRGVHKELRKEMFQQSVMDSKIRTIDQGLNFTEWTH
jgi:hypothetical protein